jgi:peptidoglycan/LPS O-acetylase OafA/YrhL
MVVIRNTLSVITGLAVFYIPVYILWTAFGFGPKDLPPDWFFVLSVVLEVLLGLAAGYVTALLTVKHVLIPCGILAGLLAMQNLAYVFFGPESSPDWPYWASLLLVTPAAVLGGLFAEKRRKGTATPAA